MYFKLMYTSKLNVKNYETCIYYCVENYAVRYLIMVQLLGIYKGN